MTELDEETVLTAEQRRKVRSSIGLEDMLPVIVRGKKASNRAYYVVALKKTDADWEKLVKHGLATSRVLNGMRIYHPTRALAESVLNENEFLLSTFWDRS